MRCFINIFIVSIILFSSTAYADAGKILEALGQGNFEELMVMRATAVAVERKFLDAVFETDGQEAAGLFEDIWIENKWHLLSWEALARLSEYHYALGDYRKYTEMQDQLKNRPPESIPPTYSNLPNAGNYWVQTGAFSNANNAMNQRKRLEQLGFSVVIIQKESQGKDLSIVRAGGFTSEEDAEAAMKEIERRMKIKPRVVQGD